MANPFRIVVSVVCAAILGGCLTGKGELRLGLPGTLSLVAVEPGVQVVEDYDEEVFFVDGQYWVRRDGTWYRSGDPHGRWFRVEPRYVPAAIVRSPPGRYAHWRGHGRDERRGDDHLSERGDGHHGGEEGHR